MWNSNEEADVSKDGFVGNTENMSSLTLAEQPGSSSSLNADDADTGTKPFEFIWGHDNHALPEGTFEAADWDALLEITKELSGDATCAYEGIHHTGGRHCVRRIRLSDRLWIARIPALLCRGWHDDDEVLEGQKMSWWGNRCQSAMESEIATMKFVAENSDIPVPKVFGCNTTLQNPVKMPYLLMECIEGNTVMDLGGPRSLTDSQRENCRKSIASIQCKLGNLTVAKIGTLALDTEGDTAFGPLPGHFGFQGPFDSPIDYFKSWAAHHANYSSFLTETPYTKEDIPPDLAQLGREFPRLLESKLETIFAKLNPAEISREYAIIHPEFKIWNILLDSNMEVVGVVDWEGAYTAPLEVFAAITNGFIQYEDDGTVGFMKGDTMGKAEKYLQELSDAEDVEGNTPRKTSGILGSVFAGLGWFMHMWESGMWLRYDLALDRATGA